MSKIDNRAVTRVKTDMRMVCSPFTTRPDCPTWSGRLVNGSRGGAYIEIDKKLKANTNVLIKVQGSRQPHGTRGSLPGMPSVFLAEVRWSKPLGESHRDGYGAGLKFI